MDGLAKLLSYKINQLANHSNQEETKRSTHQRPLTAQEVRTASLTAKAMTFMTDVRMYLLSCSHTSK